MGTTYSMGNPVLINFKNIEFFQNERLFIESGINFYARESWKVRVIDFHINLHVENQKFLFAHFQLNIIVVNLEEKPRGLGLHFGSKMLIK